MLEVTGDAFGELGELLHEAMELGLELVTVLGQAIGIDVDLDVAVEILVGVAFRGVLGQVEHFDLILSRSQPLLDSVGLMDAEVIDDEEDLLVR